MRNWRRKEQKVAMQRHAGKARIQVSISQQLLDMLDNYCNAIGVSRSAFIQTTLGQTLYSINALQASMGPALAQGVDNAAHQAERETGETLWGEDYGKRPPEL